MIAKKNIDTFGAVCLIGFSVLLGINHVVIKVVNSGIQPVLFCGLRSLIAALFIISWMKYRKIPITFPKSDIKIGILAGSIFALEFLCLFLALDYTTVIRNAIIYYSMPLWLSLLAHFVLPNESLTKTKLIGLVLAFLGVIWAILSKDDHNQTYTLFGDLCALGGAIGWAGIILLARGSSFSRIKPEMQLLWMTIVSSPLLICVSFFFGDLIRDFEIIHILGLLFQSIVVVAIGFIFWLWLLSIYPASGIASFAFLTPIFGMTFGWLFLNEQLSNSIAIAAGLIIFGIFLINKPERT
ncbi:MAG: DMT family transporter [Paracoccaceae bacterium]|nr:DMT family transporter [Paracoccaceae bacterium]